MIQLRVVFYIVTFYSFATSLQSVGGDTLKCLNCTTKNCSNEEEFCQDERENKTSLKSDEFEEASRNTSMLCEVQDYLRIKSLKCFGVDGLHPCQGPVKPGTMVTFECLPYYHTDTTLSTCLHNGSWSDHTACIPECGKTAVPMEVEPLIMYGSEMQTPAQWPWAAALHRRYGGGSWELICGGTLITENSVITAAHCVRDAITKDLLVVLGHLHRSFPKGKRMNLVNKVKRTYVLPVYRGSTNSYNSDIAIVVLASKVLLSEDIRPACLPDHRITVTPYTKAVVAGWGLDEKLKKPERLKYVQVPIVDTLKCIKHVPRTFTRYLSYSAFCAGYLNGTGVCNGDSGSGLMTQVDGRWIVQGVISISPRKGTANVCHPYNFSLYTKVMIYVDWIKKVLEFEGERQYEKEKKSRNQD